MQISYAKVGKLNLSGSEGLEVSAQVWSGMPINREEERRRREREAQLHNKVILLHL